MAPGLGKYRGTAAEQIKQFDGVETEKTTLKVKNRTSFSPLKCFRTNEAQRAKRTFDLYLVCKSTGIFL